MSGALSPYSSVSKNTPPGGSYPYYPTNPMMSVLPSSPVFVASSQSATWNSQQAADNFSDLVISENASNVNDGSDPTTYASVASDRFPLKLACNKQSYSIYSCKNPGNAGGVNLDGSTVNITPGELPQGGSDQHLVTIDTALGTEFGVWTGNPIPTTANATWSVGGAGVCSLTGNGVGCDDSIATGLPMSLGLVRAEDILYCLNTSSASSSCTLPYAVSVSFACNDTSYQFPAASSDGQCFGNQGTAGARLPEGSRACLNLTDAQINAASYRPDEKVIYRTMDCAHFGVVDRDSAYSGGPGIGPQYQGGQAYVVYGQTDPWATLAAQVGIARANGTDFDFTLTMQHPPFVYCANSKNDGLCD